MRYLKTNHQISDQAKLQLVFNANKEAFLKLVESEQKHQFVKDNLVYGITIAGKKYYRVADGAATPLERLGKLQDFFMYINTGMSAAEWTDALDLQSKLLNEGVANPNVASRLGALNIKLREMTEKVFHTELLYNIVAILTIREDEDPLTFNEQVHNEKIEAFKEEAATVGTYFFFHSTELKELSNYLKFSEAEWTALWHDSERAQMNFKMILEYLKGSGQKSTKDEKTLVTT